MESKQKNQKKLVRKIIFALLMLIIAGLVAFLLLNGKNIAVLNPHGIVAEKERDLMIITVLLGAIVIIPVFILLFTFAWRYRDTNPKTAKYSPNDDGNKWIEGVWWGIPVVIIAILSVITWYSTHDLDPYKKLDSETKPVKVQVVALQWKWLFIYPELDAVSINEVRLPEKTPINFEATADAPMNAFWIPNLGSQIYAMAGMSSKLSLEANKPGTYPGSSTNISGKGYAGMKFNAVVTNRSEFDSWVKNLSHSNTQMNWEVYSQLALPSESNPVKYYKLQDPELYNKIIMKYMSHGESKEADKNQLESEASSGYSHGGSH